MSGVDRPPALRVAAGGIELTVDPAAGARWSSLRVDGVELLTDEAGRGAIEWGGFPMAPWAGRLAGDAFTAGGTTYRMPANHEGRALHGLMLAERFEVFSRGPAELVLEARLPRTWPWPGRVAVGYRVRPGRIEADVSVSAERDAFGAGCGLHPWFTRRLAPQGAPAEVRLPAEAAMLERDADFRLSGRLVPPPPGPWDDAFEVPGRRASVVWPGELELAVESSHPWFVAFTQRPRSVCLEPQSAPPDALNDPLGLGVDVVEPGRPLLLETAWTW